MAEKHETDKAFAAMLGALEMLVAADNCNYDRDVMRSEGLFDDARRAIAKAGGRGDLAIKVFDGYHCLTRPTE